MKRQRNRCTISINGKLYDRFAAECERRGESISATVTAMIDAIDATTIVDCKPRLSPVNAIDATIVDYDPRSPTVDISASVSPRILFKLQVRAAWIRRERYATGQMPLDVSVDDLLEAMLLRALEAEAAAVKAL